MPPRTTASAARALGTAGEARPADVAPAAATDRVRVSSPGGLLAVIPVLLGFQPERSIVVIGTEPPRSQVRVTLRYDLPDPAVTGQAEAIAEHVAAVLTAQRITTAVAAGYGPEDLVAPAAAALRGLLTAEGITVSEVLRAEGDRYWSYVCAKPDCCPPEGTPYSPGDCGATGALAGGPVLASRDVLAATIAPVSGAGAESMDRATHAAEDSARQLATAAACLGRRRARKVTADPGLASVRAAVKMYRAGGTLVSRDEAARLLVALDDLRVRDDAWSRMAPGRQPDHLRMWTDLTRLARPGYVAAPASLLAFTAWQGGNGALANVALDRALADNPRYSMAILLRQVLDSGAPPSMARLPMTPEEVEASYDDGAGDDTTEDQQEDSETVDGDDAPADEGGQPALTAG